MQEYATDRHETDGTTESESEQQVCPAEGCAFTGSTGALIIHIQCGHGHAWRDDYVTDGGEGR